MIAFLQYLIAFLVAQEMPGTERPVFDPGGALVTAGVLAGIVAVAARWLRGAVTGDPEDPGAHDGGARSVALLAGGANLGRIAALVAFWSVSQSHGWCRAPEKLGIEGWVLVPHLVRLAPFFAFLAMVRAAVHHAAAGFADRPPPLLHALAADAKSAALPLAPLLVLAAFAGLDAQADRTTAWGRAWADWGRLPTVRSFVTIAVAFAALLALPWALKVAWRCRPLPPGALRERLEAYARRTGFRARDIVVWPTGGQQMNAAVVGLLPRFRYVFVTDGLLATLAPDEVEAVFAHEAGHARRGHLLLFLGYTAVLGLAGFLPAAVLGPLEAAVAPIPFAVRALLVVVLWFGVVFGWVSRRFEEEADVYGLDTLPPPRRDDGSPAPPGEHPFARALERIAAAAGGIREMTGWRHHSIAERVDFVRRYLADASVRRAYRRQILAIRGVLLVLVAAAVVAAAARVPFDLGEVRGRAMLMDLGAALGARDPADRAAHLARAARSAERAGRDDDARRWYAEAARGVAAPDVVGDWAVLLESSGRPAGAAAAWDLVAAREDAPEALRNRARERAAALRRRPL